MSGTDTIYLVRHAKAGSRTRWDGDDVERPLNGEGQRQATSLAKRLAGKSPSTLLSSIATALLGLQQLLEFLPQIIQGGEPCVAVLPGRAQLIVDEGFAFRDQLKTLLMVLQALLEDRA